MDRDLSSGQLFFFVMAQYAFPSHRNVFIFTQRVFFRVKRFQPIIRVENNIQQSLQFYMFLTQDFCVTQIQKRFCCNEVGQKTRDLYMFKPIISVVETIVKLALFCIPTFSLRLVLSSLSGPFLLKVTCQALKKSTCSISARKTE